MSFKRQVIRLYYRLGTTTKVVAERLGKNVAVVEKTLIRTRLALYDCIKAAMRSGGADMKDALSVSQNVFDEMGCLVTAILVVIRRLNRAPFGGVDTARHRSVRSLSEFGFDSSMLLDWAGDDDRVNDAVIEAGSTSFPATLFNSTASAGSPWTGACRTWWQR